MWCACEKWGTRNLYSWIRNDLKKSSCTGLRVVERTLTEGIRTGLTRPPKKDNEEITLSRFASTMRGIATGENEFFFLTSAEIEKESIPENTSSEPSEERGT